MRVVATLPRDFSAAVLLVLHMPAAFTKQFTLQLAEISKLPVKEAEANELVQPGMIYLCPGSHHLRVSATGKIMLDPGLRIEGYLPCANAALETVATYSRMLAIAVVLTGMGNDAAKGVKSIKANGGYVIAQDEASSVIFGMPAEAIKTGAVDEVVDLNEIGAAIERRVVKFAKLDAGGSAMKIAAQDAVKARKVRRPEAVILFNVSNQLFAIAADSVQEIRSTDSLGAALEIEQQEIPKVRHTIERGHRTYYVVNACAHFGLRVVRPTLVLMLRQIRVAVLVDKIERMAEISGLHALAASFCWRRTSMVSRSRLSGGPGHSSREPAGIFDLTGI